MKTIGLIGGMSWKSTLEYYRILNETTKKKLGEAHSCKCLIWSVDFYEIEKLQRNGEWQTVAEIMTDAAKKLEQSGAEILLLGANTIHKVADDIQKNIRISLVHIADATAEKIKSAGLKKVGLLGTKFTMEENFYKDKLTSNYNAEIIIPEKSDREIIHEIIYKELVHGIINDSSREIFKKIIQKLHALGAEGIILGCTEIPLLIKQPDFEIPLFDTTAIHAEAAVEMALSQI